jgi:hypothetical protein
MQAVQRQAPSLRAWLQGLSASAAQAQEKVVEKVPVVRTHQAEDRRLEVGLRVP